jgi:hypothetical protein
LPPSFTNVIPKPPFMGLPLGSFGAPIQVPLTRTMDSFSATAFSHLPEKDLKVWKAAA